MDELRIPSGWDYENKNDVYKPSSTPSWSTNDCDTVSTSVSPSLSSSSSSSSPNRRQNKNRKFKRSNVTNSSRRREDPRVDQSISSPDSKSISGPTLKVLEALSKFQTCLFVLSNSVVRLHESLKSILPTFSQLGGSQSSLVALSKSCQSIASVDINVNMIENAIRPIVRKLSHTRLSTLGIDPITKKGLVENEKDNKDTVVHVNNQDTISSDDSIATKDVTCNKLKKFEFAVILSKYAGIILVLVASLCISLVTLVVKIMEGYNPISKVIWRLQGVLIPSPLIILYVKYVKKQPLISGGKDLNTTKGMLSLVALLLMRGLIGCTADIFQYYSLKYLPLADSTVISFSTPIFVCIVAHFVLKEKWGIVPILNALLTLCGVIVICKPPFLTGEEEMTYSLLIGNILAIMCMISSTITTVIVRYLQNVHFAVTMLALGIVGTIEGLILTFFTETPFELPMYNPIDWVLAAVIAGLFFLGQLALTLALQHEEASVVSLVRTCDVLFAFVWQVSFLHHQTNIYSYVGALIVTAGVCITALRKWVSELPEHSRVRQRLFFLLR